MELEIKNVSHTYKNGKKSIIRNFHKSYPGVYGLLGPNGAGKSTLMNIITDNLRPTAGEVSLDGNVIWKNSNAYRAKAWLYATAARAIQFLYRDTFFMVHGSVKGIVTSRSQTRVNELLELVNLKDAADRRIGGYSGGMKRRL